MNLFYSDDNNNGMPFFPEDGGQWITKISKNMMCQLEGPLSTRVWLVKMTPQSQTLSSLLTIFDLSTTTSRNFESVPGDVFVQSEGRHYWQVREGTWSIVGRRCEKSRQTPFYHSWMRSIGDNDSTH